MTSQSSPARTWIPVLCWTAVLLDGFDLVVLGTVFPVLLKGHVWNLTPGTASAVGTVGLTGMVIGALTIGAVTDVIGRRKALIASVASFSAFSALCAVAPSVTVFGLLRFLAGLGLGGCLPTAITLMTEHARRDRGGSATTTVMTGYHVGAVLTALLGMVTIPSLGWRAMFVFGALPSVVLVPLMVKHLPETAAFRTASSSRGNAARALGTLFSRELLRSTLAFWVTSFMGLLLVYGLNTWLPEIMRQAGYQLGASLGLLLALNLGGVAGLVLAGKVADRSGIRRAAIAWFAAATLFLALLSVRLPGVALYAAVFLAGCFVFSAQVLVYAYVGRTYPAFSRATGLGGAAGVGRVGAICGPLLGGALLSAGIAYPWGFYVFAAVGALGAVAVAVVRREPADAPADELAVAEEGYSIDA